MTITAVGPDGVKHKFPDGTDESVIKSVLGKTYGWDKQGSTGSGVPSTPAKPEENIVQDVFRSVRAGIPFNDRISAAARTLAGIDSNPRKLSDLVTGGNEGSLYERNLAYERAKQADLAERHPVGNFIGNLAGGVISSLPMLPFSGAKAVLTAPSLAARVAEGAKLGAGYGAVQGVSDSPDLTDVKRDAGGAATGAIGGSILGGLVPAAGKFTGAALSTVADHLRPVDGMSGPAGRSMVRGLSKSSPGAIDAEFDRLGSDAMFSDVSPRMLGKTQGVFGNNDRAREIIAKELKSRGEGTSDRLLSDVNANFGKAEPPRMVEDDLAARMAKADERNYGPTMAPYREAEYPPVDTSSLLDFLNKEIPFEEGGAKKALQNLHSSLHMPNPNAPEVAAKASDFRVPMPKERVVGARDRVKSLGGISDDRGDLRDVAGMYKGVVRKGGQPADKVRETLAQEGYFDHIYGDPETAVERSTPDDLFALIDENRAPENQRGVEWQRDASRDQLGGRSQGEMWAELKQKAEEANGPKTVPKDNAINLHRLRQELDNLIEGRGEGLGVNPAAVNRKNARLVEARKKLDEILKSQVFGMREADAEHAGFAGKIEALGKGHELFAGKPGKVPLWIEELRGQRAAMSPAEQDFHKIGARGAIEEKFRKTANDLTAGKSITGGKNDFQRGYMDEIFGNEPTENVLNAVEREKTFADTANRVTGNSATAERLAAMKDETPAKIGSIRAIVDVLAKPVVERFKNDLPLSSDYYPELAKILTARGPERDRYRAALVDALTRQKEVSQANNRRGSAVALGAALGFDEGARSLLLPAVDRRERR